MANKINTTCARNGWACIPEKRQDLIPKTGSLEDRIFAYDGNLLPKKVLDKRIDNFAHKFFLNIKWYFNRVNSDIEIKNEITGIINGYKSELAKNNWKKISRNKIRTHLCHNGISIKKIKEYPEKEEYSKKSKLELEKELEKVSTALKTNPNSEENSLKEAVIKGELVRCDYFLVSKLDLKILSKNEKEDFKDLNIKITKYREEIGSCTIEILAEKFQELSENVARSEREIDKPFLEEEKKNKLIKEYKENLLKKNIIINEIYYKISQLPQADQGKYSKLSNDLITDSVQRKGVIFFDRNNYGMQYEIGRGGDKIIDKYNELIIPDDKRKLKEFKLQTPKVVYKFLKNPLIRQQRSRLDTDKYEIQNRLAEKNKHIQKINLIELQTPVTDWHPTDFFNSLNKKEIIKKTEKIPLTVDNYLEFVSQIASAIKTIHNEEYVHQDVKPQNILLDFDEEGKPLAILIDFDHIHKKDESSQACSLPYASINVDKKFTKQSDIVGLAITLGSAILGKDFLGKIDSKEKIDHQSKREDFIKNSDNNLLLVAKEHVKTTLNSSDAEMNKYLDLTSLKTAFKEHTDLIKQIEKMGKATTLVKEVLIKDRDNQDLNIEFFTAELEKIK
jgi:tRNA A-37 threonylcarbamoyl transferase component Bud32